ncbi:MAG: hypothetical protein P4L61_02215, partial [Candidatus Pacebacteria bacterium]|nr:hypothetical protein [Candidatus Paceibacterota bacterium]
SLKCNLSQFVIGCPIQSYLSQFVIGCVPSTNDLPSRALSPGFPLKMPKQDRKPESSSPRVSWYRKCRKNYWIQIESNIPSTINPYLIVRRLAGIIAKRSMIQPVIGQ